MNEKVCQCCSNTAHAYLIYPDLPEILFPVDRERVEALHCLDLHLYRCPSCNHLFQSQVDSALNERIYQEWYHYYPFNNFEIFQAPYRGPFDATFNYLYPENGAGKRLLEIGASSREAMEPFLKKGFTCTGVGPSGQGIQDEAIEIVIGRYEQIRFEQPFDVIVLRFVLEHIIDLDLFMEKLCQDLKPGGMVLVQVPNTLNFIRAGNLCIGAHEHIQYFSQVSLNALFIRYGFDVEVARDADMPSLIGCYTRGDEAVDRHYSSFNQVITTAQASLEELFTPYERICFYGAGLQLIWLLYEAGLDYGTKQLIIADDNPVLHRRYFKGVDVPILPLAEESLADCQVVVLSLNPIYYPRALAKLRSTRPDLPVIGFVAGAWQLLDNER